MALVTITDVIKDANGDFPTNGTITFRLSDWLTNSTGKIIVPTNEVTNVSAVDGTFTTTLESTLDATPGTRTYAVTFTGTLDGAVVTISLGSIAVAATPANQDLSDLLNTGTSAGNGISNVQTLALSSVEPRITFYETDQVANSKYWDIDVNSSVLTMRTRTDVDGIGTTWLTATRGTTTTMSSLQFGSSSDVYVDLTNHRLGINGTPTTGQLDVFGGAGQSARFRSTSPNGGWLDIYDTTNLAVRGQLGYGLNIFTGGSIGDFGLSAVGTLKLATSAGLVALTIDTLQRIGIGVAPDAIPGSLFQVSQGTNVRLRTTSIGSTFVLAFSNDANNVNIPLRIDAATTSFNQGPVLFTDGSAPAPSISFISQTGYGLFRIGNWVGFSNGVVDRAGYNAGVDNFALANTTGLVWTSGPSSSTADVVLVRDNANILALKNGTNAQEFRVYQTTVGPIYGRMLAIGGQTLIQSVGGSIGLSISGVGEWDINSNAHLIPSSNNTLDLGNSTTNRLRTGYFGSSVNLNIAGAGLFIKEGVNATMGTGVLVAGSATISTTKVTANSRIFLSNAGGGVAANIGSLYIASRIAGASFVVSSSNSLDTSNFVWMIVEPA